MDEEKTQNKPTTEKELNKKNELYGSVVCAINDGFWDWNIKTGEVFFSSRYYEMLGYEDNEFVPSYDSWKKLVHEHDIERAEKELQIGINNEKGFDIDFRMKMKSGNFIWVSTRGKSIEKDKEGAVVRMVGTLTDITKKKEIENKLKESERFYRLLINSIPDTTIGLFDKDLKFLVAGGVELENNNFDNKKNEGKTLHEAYPKETVEILEPLYKKALDGESATLEMPHGDFFYFHQILPLRDEEGFILGGVHISRNVTEQKKAESSIKEHDEEIEKMNRMMIGRELEMIKLKEQIKKLEEENGK